MDEPPPLEYISTLIGSNSSEADPSNPFKIGRDDDVDYSALCHLIEVLARAIDNVPAYVALEKRKNLGGQSLVKNSSFTSDSSAVDLAVDKFTNPIKRLEPSEPSLQTIIHSLTYLSSKIGEQTTTVCDDVHRLTSFFFFSFLQGRRCKSIARKAYARELEESYKISMRRSKVEPFRRRQAQNAEYRGVPNKAINLFAHNYFSF